MDKRAKTVRECSYSVTSLRERESLESSSTARSHSHYINSAENSRYCQGHFNGRRRQIIPRFFLFVLQPRPFLDGKADADATEMLVGNAENLMRTVKDVIRASEAACIRLRPGSAIAALIWKKKGAQGRRISVGY